MRNTELPYYSAYLDTEFKAKDSSFEDGFVNDIFCDRQLLRTAIALGSLNPDEDETVWRERRLAPMALHAQRNPSWEETLRWLACHWSSGALHGNRARAWTEPDVSTGRSRAWTFAYEWPRLVAGKFGSDALNLDAICNDAAEFEKRVGAPLPTLYFLEVAVERPPLHAVEPEICLMPPLWH